MTEVALRLPADTPSALRRPLLECAHGRLPANVALMQLLSTGFSLEELERALAAAATGFPPRSGAGERLGALLRLWRSTPAAPATVRAILAAVAEGAAGGPRGPEHWAAVFDRAAEISPEAGVALYSLGRADLLEVATASIVARLRDWGLLKSDTRVLDLGCGMGRLAAALASEVSGVVGTDVSDVMLEVAAARCTGLPNVSFRRTSGSDLALFPPASFDLVTAIDVFPYLVAAEGGSAGRHVAEIARVLAPGGSALVVNYSYRGDPDRDLAEIAHYAASAGLALVRCATGDFAHWDGRTFLLAFPADEAG
jgi:SAM-dependent methyltransferase